MRIELRETSFDPWDALHRHQAQGMEGRAHFGATAIFVGTMRDYNEGDSVHSMMLECYPEMTQKYLAKISDEAHTRWDILDTLIVHRVGLVKPGAPIVLIAVWAMHRAAAFDACRYLIEELKSRAPFWKKEQLDHGSRWVETNSPA